MNNKGQTLIIFVILIPLILIVFAFIVDTGMMLHEKQKAESVVDLVLKDAMAKKNTNRIKEFLEKNDIPTEKVQIIDQENTIKLQIEYSISSIFGKLVGIDHYDIQVKKKAYYDKEQIRIEKE